MDIIEVLATLWTVLTGVFGPDTSVGAKLVSIVTIAIAITGSASYLVRFLEAITDLTPSDKDDMYLDKFKRYLAKLIAFLDRIAVNPDENKARKPKE